MSDPEARLGQTIGGKYRVMRFLAAGGMGVVYEAQHVLVGRRFAIKFLRPELAQKRESLARFRREAEAAGALESENVTAVLDFGIVADGSPYLVMEYLVGENLQRLLTREGPLPLERASELVLQASRGVHAAHAAGIVHRDLKPQTLFACRREDGTELVKVLDFGVAKLGPFEEGNSATRTGSVLGTPAYMAPEQARGEKSIDHRADVYALGAILYELVSGQRPHPGDSPNAVLHHISTQPAVPLHAIRPDLPSPLLDVVGRALATEPELRFASAEAFAQALAPFARRTVWAAPPLEPAPPQRQPGAKVRPRWAWVFAGVATAGVVAALLPRRAAIPTSSGRSARSLAEAPSHSVSLPASASPVGEPSAERPLPPMTAGSAAPRASLPVATAQRTARPARREPAPVRGAPAATVSVPSGIVTFDPHNPYN